MHFVKFFQSLAVQALLKICSLIDYFLVKEPSEPKKLAWNGCKTSVFSLGR